MIKKIISGGQTGADLAGLVAAKRCGIETGGLAPKGFRTEKGNKPDLGSLYQLREHPSPSYVPRTFANAEVGDATLILSPVRSSSGTKQTITACRRAKKPFLVVNPLVDNVDEAITFLQTHQPTVLNVAGNRESVSKGLTKKGASFLVTLFNAYHEG
jgi:hypothetical protein